jgi:hypothetical protein
LTLDVGVSRRQDRLHSRKEYASRRLRLDYEAWKERTGKIVHVVDF